jgi:hypothetical protein
VLRDWAVEKDHLLGAHLEAEKAYEHARLPGDSWLFNGRFLQQLYARRIVPYRRAGQCFCSVSRWTLAVFNYASDRSCRSTGELCSRPSVISTTPRL